MEIAGNDRRNSAVGHGNGYACPPFHLSRPDLTVTGTDATANRTPKH
jgi:hypothetical protein